MRDRRGAFWFVTTAESRRLRARFPYPPPRAGAPSRATALAILAAMCEVANEHRASRFREPRGTIADYAGVSKKTLDTYVPLLVDAGLIAVERRQEHGVHLPSEWALLDVDEPAEGSRAGCAGGETISPPLGQPVREGGETVTPPRRARVEKREEEHKEPPSPPQAGGRKRAQEAWMEQVRDYAAWLLPDAPSKDAAPVIAGAIKNGARTTDEVLAFVGRWYVDLLEGAA